MSEDSPAGPWALSMTEWCKARGISKPHYWAMRKRGLTPAEIRMGQRVIITETADAEWQQRMASESAA